MKKALVILLIAVMLPVALFAGRGMMDITIGAVAQPFLPLGQLIEAAKSAPELFKEKDLYQFGAEARFRFTVLEIDAGALISKNVAPKDSDFFLKKLDYNGFVTAGVSLDLLSIVRLGAGLGMDFTWTPTDGNFYIGAPSAARTARIAALKTEGKSELVANALTAPLLARATVDFLIGPVTLGINGTIATPISLDTFANWDAWKAELEKAKQNWIDIKCGIFLGITLV